MLALIFCRHIIVSYNCALFNQTINIDNKFEQNRHSASIRLTARLMYPPPLLYLTTHQIKVFHPNYRANPHAQTIVPPLFIWCVRLVDRAVMIDEFDLEFCQQMASLVFHNR